MQSPQIVLFTGREESTGLGFSVEPYCKACLPVANRPILWWMLHAIKAEFPESGILLVVSRAFYTLVEDIVSEFRSSVTDWKNSVKLVTLPSTDRGILDALAVLSPEISTDRFFLLSADTFGALPLRKLYDLHQSKHLPSVPGLSLLFIDQLPSSEVKKKENNPRSVASHTTQTVAVCCDGCDILALRSFSDIQQASEPLKLPLCNVLERGNNISIETSLLDTHIYVLDRELLSPICELASRLEMDSFRLDVLPFLAAFQKGMSEVNLPKLVKLCKKHDALYVIKATEHPEGQHLCRIQSSDQYRVLNVKWCSLRWDEFQPGIPFHLNRLLHTSEHVKNKEVLVAQDVTLADSVMLKRSCVDTGCTIGMKSKVTGSVLFKNVKVGARVTLTNTVVCEGATIEDESQLVDCVVNAKAKVTAGTRAKKETFSCKDYSF